MPNIRAYTRVAGSALKCQNSEALQARNLCRYFVTESFRVCIKCPKTEPRRDAESRRVYRPVVAESPYFDEDQDHVSDPH